MLSSGSTPASSSDRPTLELVRFVPALLVVLSSARSCAGADASIPDVPPATASAPVSVADAGPLPLTPLTPTDPNRIPSDQQAAITSLAELASPLFPSGTNGHGHNHAGPESLTPLSPPEQNELDRQWEAAVEAAGRLESAAKANAAGYFIASTTAPGVGVHFVNWELIDKPFDPAAPSMLLFDMSGADPVLVGFSYWLRSDDVPTGFAGAQRPLAPALGTLHRQRLGRSGGGRRAEPVCGQLLRRPRPLDVARVGRTGLREPLG